MIGFLQNDANYAFACSLEFSQLLRWKGACKYSHDSGWLTKNDIFLISSRFPNTMCGYKYHWYIWAAMIDWLTNHWMDLRNLFNKNMQQWRKRAYISNYAFADLKSMSLRIRCAYQDKDQKRYELCSVGWGCRIHRLLLCRRVKPLPNVCPGYDTNNLMGRFQQCWSFGKCGLPNYRYSS